MATNVFARALALACSLSVFGAGAGCKSGKSKLDEPGVMAGSSTAPASRPSGSGSDPLAACPDSVIKPRLDEALAASKRYFVALQQHSALWSTDCEAVRKDLLTLEAEGDRFMQAMTVMKTWGATVSAECRARVETLGEANPITEELQSHSPALEARVKPVLERCNDHPGFRDAARKALRLAKKKQQP